MADTLLEAVRVRLLALASVTRFGQFASVGFVGATVDNGVLFLLVEGTPMGPVAAKIISWELAIITIFFINERWTFATYGSSGANSVGRRLLRSNLVRFGGFLVALTVLAILVYGFDVWYLAANVVGIAVGFFVNYTCESLYTWKVHLSER